MVRDRIVSEDNLCGFCTLLLLALLLLYVCNLDGISLSPLALCVCVCIAHRAISFINATISVCCLALSNREHTLLAVKS